MHGLSQALQRRALLRTRERQRRGHDAEIAAGLHHLGIVHQTTLPIPHTKTRSRNPSGVIEGA